MSYYIDCIYHFNGAQLQQLINNIMGYQIITYLATKLSWLDLDYWIVLDQWYASIGCCLKEIYIKFKGSSYYKNKKN